MVHGWKEGRLDVIIWKDGTKMDNGICIQTMPTRNYFISLTTTTTMEHETDKFLGKARFGHYEFNGRGPMLSEAFVWTKNHFSFCPQTGC